MNIIPLSERLRPKKLDDIIGQDHLLAENGALRKLLKSGKIPSLILWGPPGTGKTSIAQLLAEELKMNYQKLSAVSAGVKDLRAIIKTAQEKTLFSKSATLLFIDEIHRFNKGQQDALLESVEKGIITLVGATTENPSFEINNALLSRCIVFQLNGLQKEDLKKLLNKAITTDKQLLQYKIEVQEDDALIYSSGGDARKLLTILEFIVSLNSSKELIITDEKVNTIVSDNIANFDKKGEFHYDTISAFIKSVRGSDVDASLLYLSKMIIAGEDPKFICRRLIILASEDIGLANPNALLIANSCLNSIQAIGLPEGNIVLGQTTIYLALSPKSNSAYLAINKAIDYVKKNPNFSIPLHLRNAATQLMKENAYGEDYQYPHDFDNAWINQNYLPKNVNETFYYPRKNGTESKLIDYHNRLKKHQSQ